MNTIYTIAIPAGLGKTLAISNKNGTTHICVPEFAYDLMHDIIIPNGNYEVSIQIDVEPGKTILSINRIGTGEKPTVDAS